VLYLYKCCPQQLGARSPPGFVSGMTCRGVSFQLRLKLSVLFGLKRRAASHQASRTGDPNANQSVLLSPHLRVYQVTAVLGGRSSSLAISDLSSYMRRRLPTPPPPYFPPIFGDSCKELLSNIDLRAHPFWFLAR